MRIYLRCKVSIQPSRSTLTSFDFKFPLSCSLFSCSDACSKICCFDSLSVHHVIYRLYFISLPWNCYFSNDFVFKHSDCLPFSLITLRSGFDFERMWQLIMTHQNTEVVKGLYLYPAFQILLITQCFTLVAKVTGTFIQHLLFFVYLFSAVCHYCLDKGLVGWWICWWSYYDK